VELPTSARNEVLYEGVMEMKTEFETWSACKD
jgi:hypothetical protein